MYRIETLSRLLAVQGHNLGGTVWQQDPRRFPLFHLSRWPSRQPAAGRVPHAGHWAPTADTRLRPPRCSPKQWDHVDPSQVPIFHGEKHVAVGGRVSRARGERGKRACLCSAPRCSHGRAQRRRPVARLCPRQAGGTWQPAPGPGGATASPPWGARPAVRHCGLEPPQSHVPPGSLQCCTQQKCF